MRMLGNANSHSRSKLNKQREMNVLNLLVFAAVYRQREVSQWQIGLVQ